MNETNVQETLDEMDFYMYIQSNLRYILGFIIIMNFIIIVLMKLGIRARSKVDTFLNLNKKKEVLLIISHPDDECMFFSPTLKNLLSQKVAINILCLSNGDYYKQGKTREKELSKVADFLDLKSIEILEDDKLQDDINKLWEFDYVGNEINEYFKRENGFEKFGSIITFDEKGVSRHPNHISTSNGVISFLRNNKQKIIDSKIETYFLDTYPWIMQYSFLFPLIGFYLKDYGFLNKNALYTYNLMKIHFSQFNFYRKLHTLISGYTYFNTYTKLEFS